jgi:hypothetical protein
VNGERKVAVMMNWLRRWRGRRENRDVVYILHMMSGGVGFVGMSKQDGCVFIDCPKCFEQDGYVGSKVYPRRLATLPPGAERYENSEKYIRHFFPDLVSRALWCSEGHEWRVWLWRKSLRPARRLAFLDMFKPGSGWVS